MFFPFITTILYIHTSIKIYLVFLYNNVLIYIHIVLKEAHNTTNINSKRTYIKYWIFIGANVWKFRTAPPLYDFIRLDFGFGIYLYINMDRRDAYKDYYRIIYDTRPKQKEEMPWSLGQRSRCWPFSWQWQIYNDSWDRFGDRVEPESSRSRNGTVIFYGRKHSNSD